MIRVAVLMAMMCLSVSQLSCANDSRIAASNLLWPDGIKDNPITYEKQDVMRTYDYGHPDAPLGTCRVYSHVSTPTYYIYQPEPQNNTGVGIVVLPGGGYRDIWLDTEGHDIGLFFKERGITSLVVKYRTNSPVEGDRTLMDDKDYVPYAVADAREGIRILRSKSKELKIDPRKIGVGGFRQGGI